MSRPVTVGAFHGTRARYSAGCRCDQCREANRAYMETRRRAAGVQPLRCGPQTEHGTPARYWRGCRCDDCKTANTRYSRARRQANRASA